MGRKSAPSKRVAAGRKQNYKRRGRRSGNVPDIASCSEAYTFGNQNLATGSIYFKKNFQLADFPRARAIASAYQHYRIKKITLRFKSQIDTFIGGGGYTVPQLYYMIDKSGSIPNLVSVAALESMGAKPHRLDDKVVTVSWAPSVLTETAVSVGVDSQTQYRVSPWLSTNANTLSTAAWAPSLVDHLGIVFTAVCPGALNQIAYSCDAMVEFEFKKPLNATLSEGGQPAIEL